MSRHEANALFDSGSTQSFVSHVFASKLENPPSALAHALVSGSPTGEQICTRTIYYDCVLEVGQTTVPVNLVLLCMNDFYVVLGMDWLSRYQAVLDCFNKMVRFKNVCVVRKRKTIKTGNFSD